MKNKPYTVDSRFASLLPADETAAQMLEIEIRADGKCRDPFVIGRIAGEENTVLVDGHTRDMIVAKLRAENVTVEAPQLVVKEFANADEVVSFIFNNQNARRNWGPEDRARAILANQEMVIEERDKATGRRKAGVRAPQGSTKRVDQILAEKAGVSDSTIKRVRRVIESNNQEVIAQLFNPDTDKRISIAEASRSVRNANKDADIAERAEQARLARAPYLTVEDDGVGYENRIVVGDCLDILKRVPAGAATMVICSPPYPIPHERVGYDVYKYPGYQQWLADFAARCAEFYRVLRVGGRFALNLDLTSDRQAGQATKYPALMDAYNIARNVGFGLLDGFTWYKQKASGDRPNWGSYASPTAPNVRRVDEPVLLFYKENPHLEGDDSLADMLPGDFEHATISTWNYDATNKCAAEMNVDSFWYVPTAKAQPGGNPVPYPEKLVDLLLKVWTRRGDLVIDPYNGSGTTTYVAQQLGRRYLGIDLSSDYCAEARERLDKKKDRKPCP